MQTKYLVTVIIPHYNSPIFLERLLKSIPNRPDFQVVVVDDNSTKDRNVLEACKTKYSAPNRIFLRNESGKNSAGTCRNIGIEHAEGEWLLFADADDVFTEEAETVLEKYLQSKYDIVFFTPTSFDYETGQKVKRHEDVAKLILNYLNKGTREAELRIRYFHVCPWSKLIRKSLVDEHHIQYDATMVSNDVMFSTKCGHYAKTIAATTEEIYCVTKTAGSLVTQTSEKNFDIRTNVLIDKYLFLKDNLSIEDCKLIRIDGLPGGRIYEMMKQYKSVKKLFTYIFLFYKKKVPVFTWRMLNPIVVVKAIKKRL